jgi:hypothetical protein
MVSNFRSLSLSLSLSPLSLSLSSLSPSGEDSGAGGAAVLGVRGCGLFGIFDGVRGKKNSLFFYIVTLYSKYARALTFQNFVIKSGSGRTSTAQTARYTFFLKITLYCDHV